MNINKELNKICSILLAKTIKDLYPDCTIGDAFIGDQLANESGFSYCFKLEKRLSITDLPMILKQMHKNIDRAFLITYKTISKKEALELFKDNKFKIELINDCTNDTIEIVSFGDEFNDICEKTSIAKLSAIKQIKLINIAGEYWKHNAKNEQLQAITGIAFENAKDLEEYEAIAKDRSERDHRNINSEMELFSFDELVGPGLPFWMPNGAAIKYEIDDYVHKLLQRNGYDYVQTPVLGTQQLYETSGHWFHYRENMFSPLELDKVVELLRPMTCPHHILCYKMKPKSYKELPFRVYEDAILHRYESSGSLTGLERVRQMRLIDCHMICTPNQIKNVVMQHYKIIEEAAQTFNIKLSGIQLALHDVNNKEKFFDNEPLWQQAENKVREVLKSMGKKEGVDYYEAIGEAAFYGPKIDMEIKTALGRNITAFTIQLDFLLPEKFNLEYIDEKGKISRPVLVHASVIGTLERFMSILLEQNKGIFPLWLAPQQVQIIPVDIKTHGKYCAKLVKRLLNELIRSKCDERDERLAKKIRDAQIKKIPYQLVIGDNEIKNKTISFRKYGSEKSEELKLSKFISMLKKEVKIKK